MVNVMQVSHLYLEEGKTKDRTHMFAFTVYRFEYNGRICLHPFHLLTSLPIASSHHSILLKYDHLRDCIWPLAEYSFI
jgi:hypothetical protein